MIKVGSFNLWKWEERIFFHSGQIKHKIIEVSEINNWKQSSFKVGSANVNGKVGITRVLSKTKRTRHLFFRKSVRRFFRKPKEQQNFYFHDKLTTESKALCKKSLVKDDNDDLSWEISDQLFKTSHEKVKF